MLFKIEGGDSKLILEALQEFQKEAEEEYKAELASSKRKLNAIRAISPISMNVSLPDELMMIPFEKDGIVFLRIGLYVPKIVSIMRKHKAMERNLRMFLDAKGIKGVRVKMIPDNQAWQ